MCPSSDRSEYRSAMILPMFTTQALNAVCTQQQLFNMTGGWCKNDSGLTIPYIASREAALHDEALTNLPKHILTIWVRIHLFFIALNFYLKMQKDMFKILIVI